MPLSLIDIIILNYFREDLTVKCLKSLKRQSFKDFSIIVVDNGSQDQQIFERNIKTIFPTLLYFKSVKNVGFAGGVNIGLKHTNAKYILLLNNDTVVSPIFLERCIYYIKKSPKYLAVSPWIADGQRLAFAYAYVKPFERHYTAHSYHHSGIKNKEIIECDYLPLTAVLLNRALLKKLGNIPTNFFMYYEDALLGIKARKMGLKLISFPEVLVNHEESSSSEAGFRQFFIYRSRIIFMFQAFTGFNLFLAFVTFIKNFLRDFITDILKHERKTTYYRIKGIMSLLH